MNKKCSRCDEIVHESNLCGKYGCVNCCDGHSTHNVVKSENIRQSLVMKNFGIYNSGYDKEGKYGPLGYDEFYKSYEEQDWIRENNEWKYLK